MNKVDIVPLSRIITTGQKNVTTAGTAEVLASASNIKSIAIKAKSTNTGNIFVGTSTVSSTTGYILTANETVTLDLDSTSDIYINSSVSGEGVSYIAIG